MSDMGRCTDIMSGPEISLPVGLVSRQPLMRVVSPGCLIALTWRMWCLDEVVTGSEVGLQ